MIGSGIRGLIPVFEFLVPRILSLSLVGALVLTGSAGPVAASTGEGVALEEVVLEEYADVAREPLVLDPARVALFGAGAEGVASTAPGPVASDSWPIAGWSLAHVPAATGDTAARTRELVRSWGRASDGGFVSPVFVGLDGGPVFVTPVLLVGFEDGVPRRDARGLLAAHPELEVLAEDYGRMRGAYRLAVDVSDGYRVLDLARGLVARAEVRFAEPDWVFTGAGGYLPNDPSFAHLWGLDNAGQSGGTPDVDINATEAWDITQGDAAIRVVVIDTGVQQDHPDINQLGGADVTSDGPGTGGPVNSWDRHGTPVAGCVSATIDNSLGVVGAAPQCPSISVRTFISVNGAGNWTSQASWTVDALTHAETVGARVTCNSNGYGFTSSAIESKYQSTRDGGMLHFASAGNFSSSTATYPATLSSVLGISSVDRFGSLSSFSNFGVDIAFTGPGTEILSTDLTGSAGYSPGDYATVEGTSFATPTSAGVAALVLSLNDSLDANSLEAVLQSTVKDLGPTGWDTSFGHGLMDAHAALLATPCPTPRTYCSNAANSTGMAAQIGFSGTPSLTTNSFVLSADQCPPGVFGLFFYGREPSTVPFGDGSLCVSGVIQRLPTRMTDAQGSVVEPLDLSASPFDAGPGQVGVGAERYFQFWYRDQAAGGAGFNLTDGLAVTFCN